MTLELSPKYNSKDVETKWYTHWEKEGYFRPASDRQGKNQKSEKYVVVIPPPNVTGILHMGHALNNTIQDVLIRWNRMRGKDTLWVPGVDHAGIATQNVVERKLAKEKKTRHDLGRGAFLKEVWKWKEAHGNTITNQLRRLGASCDWSRERFTMDENLSKAVVECFVRLFEKGLIYQGHYIINWCPRCQTALSDEESAHRDVQGGFYHIKYPIAGAGEKADAVGKDHIVVATTRPETMLGDTAVAVNPEDDRYRHLVGKKLILPLIEREIPIIADAFVDPEFGTGLVKVTPAHDPNDFEMGKRHELPEVNVMHPNGEINEHGGPYEGMDRFAARKKVVEDLEAKGLFIKKEKHKHSVGHCYRCDTMVEPYLSKQWFVKMKPLAEKALEVHKQGKTVFYPDRWTKVYTNWLEGIRDWCISRQIWWGHQIPIWYDEEGHAFAGHSEEEAKEKAKKKHGKEVFLTQDPDVLDTWFSSWLWPFSTLGWPDKKSEDVPHFYPTSDLITAAEIIFFWVARMIMAGLEFVGKEPFSRVHIHGTVRAEGGLKMSKSLGNSIDPLEVIDEMGADALRFSMIMLSAQDVYLSRDKFEVGRNFNNKIWNATRFIFLNMKDFKAGSRNLDLKSKSLPIHSRWILSRLERVTGETNKHLGQFGLSQGASELYHFVWNDFCDWFIEFAKPMLTAGSQEEKESIQKVLFYVMEKILKLLHPFSPFITEELWQKMKAMAADKDQWAQSVMIASWPEEAGFRDLEAERLMKKLQDGVSAVRDMRAQLGVPPSQKVTAVLKASEGFVEETFKAFQPAVEKLGKLELKIDADFKGNKSYLGKAFSDFEIFLYLEGLVDPEKERERMHKEIESTKRYLKSISGKLQNKNFVSNAPKEIVDKEKEKLEDTEKKLKAQEKLLALFE